MCNNRKYDIIELKGPQGVRPEALITIKKILLRPPAKDERASKPAPLHEKYTYVR